MSIVKILKRIEKLTALTKSLQKYLADERVVKTADKLYRDHVGIPMDAKHQGDQNLFSSLDKIGHVIFEKEDDEEEEDKDVKHDKPSGKKTAKKTKGGTNSPMKS